jgi:siroheme synthase (precorrin-2 oxidase/ferrochelatase)
MRGVVSSTTVATADDEDVNEEATEAATESSACVNSFRLALFCSFSFGDATVAA